MKKLFGDYVFIVNNPDDDYIKIEKSLNGFNDLKIGSHIKYDFCGKRKSAGFLTFKKSSPIKEIKNLYILVLKNKNTYFEMPFFKYIYYQKSNKKKLHFYDNNNDDERNNILDKCRNIIKSKKT